MSTIEALGIVGIRSYNPDPKQWQAIDFQKPLTLILGNNGSGKTTIIECLKMITSGSLPPNSKSGKHFVMDPQIAQKSQVTAQIKLKFKAINKKAILCIKTF